MSILLGHPTHSSSIQRRKSGRGLDSLRHGSQARISPARTESEVTYNGEAPLMTVAPTGAGKGVSVIIPTLLSYAGSVLVIDPKGENYAVTSRYRRQLGHQVYKLDPFRIESGESSAINPFDTFSIPGASVEADSMVIAELISSGKTGTKEPFWDISAQSLIAGMVAYIYHLPDVKHHALGHLRELLHRPKFDEDVEAWVKEPRCHPYAKEELGSYINLPSTGVRPSVLGTARSYLKTFSDAGVRASVGKGGILLNDVIDRVHMSIYLIVPPDKLKTCGSLLRVWIGVLLRALMSRRPRNCPARHSDRTLLLLDEVAQLGNFPYLESVVTLGRGYGIQAWMFWQDFAQLKTLYQDAWRTLINNCDVVQMFGARNHMVKTEFCDLLGVQVGEIESLASDEQILVMNSGGAYRASRRNYLNESMFKDRRDPHPFHDDGNVDRMD